MKIPSLASVVTAALMFTSGEATKMAGNRNIIIGGQDAPRGRYGYMAGLHQSRNGRPVCGGSLIAPNVVYTAAHCSAVSFVSVGCYDTNDCETVPIVRKYIYPSYDGTPIPQRDFMLLELGTNFNAQPIAVADASYANVPVGTDVTIIGWGRTVGTDPNSGARILQETEVDVLSNSVCNGAYSPSVTDDMICTRRQGTGGCRGDSGGPLMIRCDNARDVLIGVVSWGSGTCVTSQPTVYGRISWADTWFKSTMSQIGASVATPPPAGNVCGGGAPSPVPPPVPTPIAPPTPPPTNCFFGFC